MDSNKTPPHDDKSYQLLLQKYGANSKILFITADIKGEHLKVENKSLKKKVTNN